jgi:carbonic anhydrase
MERLMAGVKQFQTEVFPEKRALFKNLAGEQHPEVLFITCADSRIDPHLITQSEPGDIFVAHNAGNLVPPEGSVRSSEAASVEYAIKVLGVRQIVVCGHSDCGAMKAVARPESQRGLPAVGDWLAHAQDAWRAAQSAGDALDFDERLRILIEQNVLAQLQHLITYSVVTQAFSAGRLKLHGWVYDIETGKVYQHGPAQGLFVELT